MIHRDSSGLTPVASQRWLHRFAVLTACATFPLILVGGLVTSYDVGMADPVWPTPPWYLVWLAWMGHAMERGLGFLIEHSHRQLGWLVGLLTLVLAVWLWFAERRRWLRWLGVAALAAVSVQGVLGGLRVIWQNRTYAVVHGCAAQAFFSLMVCLAMFTARRWTQAAAPAEATGAGRLQRLALTTTGLVFLQLILGAILRHLWPAWALVAHLVAAFLIVAHVVLLARRIFSGDVVLPQLVGPTKTLCLLVAGQIGLGMGAWATRAAIGEVSTDTHVLFATTHVVLGALILATCVALTVNCYRYLVRGLDDEARTPDRERSTERRRLEAASVRPSVSSLEPRELLMLEGSA